MDIVTEHLTQLIAEQVDDKGLVVWYDPEQAYESVVAKLAIPKSIVARFNGSFFKLRKEIDHLMNDGQAPRLVIYVPLEREKTHAALIELESAGVVMQPQKTVPACNTRLSVVARNALKPILGEGQVSEIERQVEAGKLSLADLNSLADKGKDISTGLLTLIFGTAHPQDVAMAFLCGDHHDKEIEKKAAQKDLWHLLQANFEINLDSDGSLIDWRLKLGRHVLATDLCFCLKKNIPSALSMVSKARRNSSIDACVRLAHMWRNSREHRNLYITVANKFEQELALNQIDLPLKALEENDSFLCIEQSLQRYVETELLNNSRYNLLNLANQRISRFWSDVEPKIQSRWALIKSVTEVLLQADRIENEIKNASTSVKELVKAYAEGDQPWCLLDTHHRHMESRKYNFEFDGGDDHLILEKLIIKAEQRYTLVGGDLAKHFTKQFAKSKHPVSGLLQQRELFEKYIKPHLGEQKVAYLWIDALRYEMARELSRLLADDFTIEISPAIGTIPTITEIGMAALLPKAHESAKVVSVGGGKLGLEVDGKVLKDRKDRVTFLKENAGVQVFDAKLEDLLPKPNKKVKEGIENANLILITSQEIDELGESDNVAQARLQIDGVLSHVRRGVRILADQGIKTIVLVSDHGHLFADEVGEDMKIESPGGKIEDLHRRVWIGVGGKTEASYLRTSLTSLGVDSEFDIATPWNFAVFKTKGGGRAYFHGGLSPQELIVPVVVMQSKNRSAARTSGIEWNLIPGTAKLTTRFFSVQILGKLSNLNLFGFEPPKVRIELRANRKCVSIPVSASYGFEDATAEVSLKVSEKDKNQIEPNTVTIMLSEEITQKTVGIYLIDAITGAELLPPVTVDVAISM